MNAPFRVLVDAGLLSCITVLYYFFECLVLFLRLITVLYYFFEFLLGLSVFFYDFSENFLALTRIH